MNLFYDVFWKKAQQIKNPFHFFQKNNIFSKGVFKKFMDEQLKEAWLKGHVFSLDLILSNKNAADCVGLLECGSNNMDWKYNVRPVVARIFLEKCIRQKIESIILEKIGAYCSVIGQYGGGRNSNELRDLALSITYKAQKQQRANKDNCRKVIITLLGCCGKQRRAKGGILKDVGMIIAKNVWKTKRMDLWK